MKATIGDRLEHILDAARLIKSLLDGRTIDDLRTQPIVRAAFERFIEIISEASRYIPTEAKANHPEIPWADIAAIGNRIRHGYDRLREELLWAIYEVEIDKLLPVIHAIRKEFE